MKNQIERREFLRGAGAFALAFPGLSSWSGLTWKAPEIDPKKARIFFHMDAWT